MSVEKTDNRWNCDDQRSNLAYFTIRKYVVGPHYDNAFYIICNIL